MDLLLPALRPNLFFMYRYIPQIAFLGRSNVGKSSLVGALLGNKSLVRVSKKPGMDRHPSTLLSVITHYLQHHPIFSIILSSSGYLSSFFIISIHHFTKREQIHQHLLLSSLSIFIVEQPPTKLSNLRHQQHLIFFPFSSLSYKPLYYHQAAAPVP